MVSKVLVTEVQSTTVLPTGGNAPLQLENMQPGMVLAITPIRYNSPNTTPRSNPSGILFGGSFTKLRTDTNIRVTATVFGNGAASGNCAVGVRYDNTWDYGFAYQYDSAYSSQCRLLYGSAYFVGGAAGIHSMYIGWNTINNSAGEYPFTTLNPGTSVDARNRPFVSSLLVYEVYP